MFADLCVYGWRGACMLLYMIYTKTKELDLLGKILLLVAANEIKKNLIAQVAIM